MENIKKFSEYEKINENTTDHFVINKKTKKIEKHGLFNSREYWVKGGKAEGEIDMVIEIFANYNHKKEAEKIYKALVDAGLENKYYSIKVEVKSGG